MNKAFYVRQVRQKAYQALEHVAQTLKEASEAQRESAKTMQVTAEANRTVSQTLENCVTRLQGMASDLARLNRV
jgi:hypothetical protein